MSNWENNVRKVVPYTPGEQPKESGIIKLNTNENPYPPSPAVKAVLDGYSADELRLYPDPEASELVEAIAEEYSVKPKQVFVGVGSDDVISVAFQTFFNSDKPLLFPDITYSFYDVWAEVYGIPYRQLPLTDGFHIRPEDYVQPNGGIIFPNPNAPTGMLEDLGMIEKVVKANPNSVVVIDEAYIDFAGKGKSAVPLTEKYENLLVVQTFSKSRNLAGLRIGFAIGGEKLIKYMNDIKFSVNSYTMNRMTIKCGAAAVRDRKYFEETTAKITATRETAKKELTKRGFTFPDSQSNFIFAHPPKLPAKTVFEELKKRKIFVRYWDKPKINGHLRITIGTDAEMNALYKALDEILQEV